MHFFEFTASVYRLFVATRQGLEPLAELDPAAEGLAPSGSAAAGALRRLETAGF